MNVPCGGDDLTAHFRRRCAQTGDIFAVETPPGRLLHIVFNPPRWLFKLTLKFWFSDGTWRGSGSLETNTTRLFGAIGGFQNFADEIYVPDGSLLAPVRFTPNPFGTLDGKDNFVPPNLLSQAMRTDWCALTGSYLQAVVVVVNTLLGSAFDFDASSLLHDPLVRIPPPDRWTLKEAEIYSECRDVNAPMRVSALCEVARGMSSDYTRTAFGEHGVAIEGRSANMPSLRVRLGANGVQLSAYAKAFDRLRLEVRYSEYPMRVCRLTAEQYHGRNDGAVEALRGVRSNALRRLRRFLNAHQQHGLEREPTLTCLTRALSIAAYAPPQTPVTLYRVLSLLIVNGGVSLSTVDADARLFIDHLIATDVLRPSQMTPRGQHDYVLGPTYAAAFRQLRNFSRY